MKEIIDTVKETDSRWVANYVGTFLSTVAPGILIIYLYKPNLFVQLETLKFVLFALALSLPLWIVNILILGPPNKREGIDNFIGVIFFASLASSISYYFSLLVCYIFTLQFLWFIIISLIANTVPLFFICNVFPKPNKALKRDSAKNAAPLS